MAAAPQLNQEKVGDLRQQPPFAASSVTQNCPREFKGNSRSSLMWAHVQKPSSGPIRAISTASAACTEELSNQQRLQHQRETQHDEEAAPTGPLPATRSQS